MERLVAGAVSGVPACSVSAVSDGGSDVLVPVSRRALVASLVASSAWLVASVPPSLALKYDDYVRRAGNVKAAAATSGDGSSFVDFVSANPVTVLLGAATVAVPFVALRASGIGQPFGTSSAAAAFGKLSDPEQNAQLLDIRPAEDVRASGRPDLKSIRRKAIQVAYDAEDKKFVTKVLSKCRNAENTALFILDRLDGNSATVAQLLVENGFKKAYAVQGGVEGANGWQASGLPWLLPRKSFNLNLDGLKNLFNGSQDNSNLVPVTLGAAAAAGIGVAVFTEAETVLQLLGSAAFIQIFAKKFMFADDREKTIKEVQTFLDTKVAPKDLADELKDVGRILLPKEGEVRAAAARGGAALENKVRNVESPVAPGNGAQIRDAGAA